jgi:hypothetical protein
MDNIQFWIWLIVIVITLIARARKKPKPVEPDSSEMPSRQRPVEEEGSKPMTFEELLREIQGAKTVRPEPVATTSTVEVEDYEDEAKTEEKRLEQIHDTHTERQKTYDIYEKAKQEAFFRPSLEESLKLEDTIIRFGQFKGYQQGESRNLAAEFAKEIKTPGGFRKAFIMSEILQRRF